MQVILAKVLCWELSELRYLKLNARKGNRVRTHKNKNFKNQTDVFFPKKKGEQHHNGGANNVVGVVGRGLPAVQPL